MAQPVSQPSVCCNGLTSALHVAEWSASGPGRIDPEQRAPRTQWTENLLDPEATEDKNCRPDLNQTTTRWLCSPYGGQL